VGFPGRIIAHGRSNDPNWAANEAKELDESDALENLRYVGKT